MEWYKMQKERNYPMELGRMKFPNLWKKYETTNGLALEKDVCCQLFQDVVTGAMLKDENFVEMVKWDSLEDFDPGESIGDVMRFLHYTYPNLALVGLGDMLDPVGHTAFARDEMRETWEACERMEWGNFPKKYHDRLDELFRVDIYGNVVSLYCLPNTPIGFAFDHYFPFSRGGRTRKRPGSTEGNIIIIQWKANGLKKDIIEQLIAPHKLQTGISPSTFSMALRSQNGYYGIPSLLFFLGYDPILNPEKLPDRSSVYSEWSASKQQEILSYLQELRDFELKRETSYIEKKQKRANRKPEGTSNTKVNPYTFSQNDPNDRTYSLFEYKTFLKACLTDKNLAESELEALSSLKNELRLSDDDILTILDSISVMDYNAMIPNNLQTYRLPTVEDPLITELPLNPNLENLQQLYIHDEIVRDMDKLEKMKISELKSMCKENSLKASGKKVELIARLNEHLEKISLIQENEIGTNSIDLKSESQIKKMILSVIPNLVIPTLEKPYLIALYNQVEESSGLKIKNMKDILYQHQEILPKTKELDLWKLAYGNYLIKSLLIDIRTEEMQLLEKELNKSSLIERINNLEECIQIPKGTKMKKKELLELYFDIYVDINNLNKKELEERIKVEGYSSMIKSKTTRNDMMLIYRRIKVPNLSVGAELISPIKETAPISAHMEMKSSELLDAINSLDQIQIPKKTKREDLQRLYAELILDTENLKKSELVDRISSAGFNHHIKSKSTRDDLLSIYRQTLVPNSKLSTNQDTATRSSTPKNSPKTKKESISSPKSSPKVKKESISSPKSSPKVKKESISSPKSSPKVKKESISSPKSSPKVKKESISSPKSSPKVKTKSNIKLSPITVIQTNTETPGTPPESKSGVSMRADLESIGIIFKRKQEPKSVYTDLYAIFIQDSLQNNTKDELRTLISSLSTENLPKKNVTKPQLKEHIKSLYRTKYCEIGNE